MTQQPDPKRHEFTTAEGHHFRHVNDALHSEEDRPAVVYSDGTQWWYHEGKVHRVNGPAVMHPNGVHEWWQNNGRHRVGGPAVIYPDAPGIAPQLRGVKQWWTNGKLVREDLPPKVLRYRKMLEQAYKTCFGSSP